MKSYRIRFICFVAVCFIVSGLAMAIENEPRKFSVNLRGPEATYFLESPIRFRYYYGANREHYFGMNHRGYPKRLEFKLSDSKGNPVPPPKRDVIICAPGARTDDVKLYANVPIPLEIDLNTLFQIDKPDEYTLSVWSYDAEEEIFSAPIHVVALNDTTGTEVNGFCEFPGYYTKFDDGSMSVACNVAIGPITGNNVDARQWYMRIERNIMYDDKPTETGRLIVAHPIDADAKLVKAALDRRWRLWAILERGNERSLIICNVLNGQFQTPIAWTTKEITLEATQVIDYIYSKMVVAGVPGEIPFSTYSLDVD